MMIDAEKILPYIVSIAPINLRHESKRRHAMKKGIAISAIAAMTLGLTTTAFADGAFEGCQTASAYLDQGGNEVAVTVDLSDGWTVDFAPSAVYLYDGPNNDDTDAVAIGLTLEEDVYNGYIADAENQTDYRMDDGITSYIEEDGSYDYFFEVGDDSKAYFMISVNKDAEGDAVMSRIAVERSIRGDVSEAFSFSSSELFSDEDIASAMDKVLEEFNTWSGCELISLSYAGDDASTEEKLDWVNELDEEAGYEQVMELLMDFHSPTDEADLEGTAWNPDSDYTGYEWWLARTEGGEWVIVTHGF